MICHCENVEFGSYDNTVNMLAPFTQRNILGEPKKSDWVCIDTCIATEIGWLWHQGVKTLNSCCGHKKIEPTVIVDKGSTEKMKELGYKETTLEVAMPKQTFVLCNKQNI